MSPIELSWTAKKRIKCLCHCPMSISIKVNASCCIFSRSTHKTNFYTQMAMLVSGRCTHPIWMAVMLKRKSWLPISSHYLEHISCIVEWVFASCSVWYNLCHPTSSFCRGSSIPYNCHFFYTDTIFVRIKFTPKNAKFSR